MTVVKPTSQLIRTAEAAKVLGRSVAWTKQAALDGELPYVQKLNGRTGAYLFDRAVIEAIANQRGAA